MAYPYLIQGNNIIIVVNNQHHTINKNHFNYQKVLEAIQNNDWTTVESVINPERVVTDFGEGNIEIQGNRLFWQGRELKNSLVTKIVQMIEQGFSVEPLVNFMDNLMKNPSMTAVNELYRFLEVGNLPITPDGHFLAFKKVNADYLDVHSRSVCNKPADLMTEEEKAEFPKTGGRRNEVRVEIVDNQTVVSMPRNAVDDQRNNTCSHGLHFCSLEYLNHFGGENTLIVKINPADVVSIPSDYNDTKGRTWKYVVTGVLEGSAQSVLDHAVQIGK